MRPAFARLWPSDFRPHLALVYTAVLLTTLEFWWLPARLEARRLGLPFGMRAAPTLESGLLWVAACVVGFLVVPLIIVLVVHRERPSSIGFRLKGFHRHVWIYLGLYAVMLPAVIFASEQAGFRNLYPFVSAAKSRWDTFVRWEIAYLIQFIALEAFFRGYLLFTLEKRFGNVAVFVMTVPYAMIHFHKPPLEAFGAIFAGIILGSLALRFRSWAGGAVLHGLVALTMDSLAAHQSGLF